MIGVMGIIAVLLANGMASLTIVYYKKLGIDCPSRGMLMWFYRVIGVVLIVFSVI